MTTEISDRGRGLVDDFSEKAHSAGWQLRHGEHWSERDGSSVVAADAKAIAARKALVEYVRALESVAEAARDMKICGPEEFKRTAGLFRAVCLLDEKKA